MVRLREYKSTQRLGNTPRSDTATLTFLARTGRNVSQHCESRMACFGRYSAPEQPGAYATLHSQLRQRKCIQSGWPPISARSPRRTAGDTSRPIISWAAGGPIWTVTHREDIAVGSTPLDLQAGVAASLAYDTAVGVRPPRPPNHHACFVTLMCFEVELERPRARKGRLLAEDCSWTLVDVEGVWCAEQRKGAGSSIKRPVFSHRRSQVIPPSGETYNFSDNSAGQP